MKDLGQRIFGNTSYESLKASCTPYVHVELGESRVVDFPKFPKEEEILFAHIDEDSYEGSFHMVWRRDGKLFEMRNSHCSCNSYSDDFDSWKNLQPISLAYLANQGKPYWLPKEAEPLWDAVMEGSV